MTSRWLAIAAALPLAGGCALVLGYDDYEDAGAGGGTSGSTSDGATSSSGTSADVSGPGVGGGDAGGGGANAATVGPGTGGGGDEGGGGAGGGTLSCEAPSDCPGIEDECQTRSCEANVCGIVYADDGFEVSTQVGQDCRVNVCDGAGNVVERNDPDDRVDDENECTVDACEGGVPTHEPVADDTACGQGLGCVDGVCTGCNAPSDCGVSGQCFTWACLEGACAQIPVSPSTPCGMSASCANGVEARADYCDGTTCADGGTVSCGAYACGTTECRDTCDDEVDCAPDHACVGSACVPYKPLGASCAGAGECASGFCDGDVCCDEACSADDPCRSCRADQQQPGGVSGNCRAAATGTICDPDDNCVSDHEVGPLACSASGTCTASGPPTESCGYFACEGGACRTSCSGGSGCANEVRCESSTCCLPCAYLLDSAHEVAADEVCSSSDSFVDALKSCGCAACATECISFCNESGPVSGACGICLSQQGCNAQLTACANDD